jgi:hypothetical protein
MARAKYDPLEASKIGTDEPPQKPPADFQTAAADRPPVPPSQGAGAPAPARRPKFRVVKDARVSIRGQLCVWKAGRILDSAGYDIEHLRATGTELEVVQE